MSELENEPIQSEATELIQTRNAVDAFLSNRSEEGYKAVLRAFVFEAMSTERCALFPTSTEIMTKFVEGGGPFSSAIIRDGGGHPYLVFLTTNDRENNHAETVVAIKASEMLINMMKDGALAGVALDPWNGGGVALPKNLLLDEIQECDKMLDNERKENMTINLTRFKELREAILSAGQERVLEIKKEIAERLARGNYKARNGEDPTGGWYLYLDALCDLRLGAFSWDGGKIIAFSRGELNLLADWYETLSEVARSVNRRQKDGRSGCNESKLNALSDFIRCKAAEIDALLKKDSRYVMHLREMTDQIMRMKLTGNWSTVGKVEVYRGQ